MKACVSDLLGSVKRIAIVCADGIGDGLIFLTLAFNLKQNGFDVVLFSSIGSELQDWFPDITMEANPSIDELENVLGEYDLVFAQAHSRAEAISGKIGPKCYVFHKTYIDRKRSMVENLFNFCKDMLGLVRVSKDNGIRIPKGVIKRRYKNRVVLHPTSKDPIKNWSKKKFLSLAKKLQRKGYSVSFVMSPEERPSWKNVVESCFEVPYFYSLDMLARYVCESGWMIGTDSAIGHLANCIGIPTLTIFSRKGTAMYWRPGWNDGIVIYPKLMMPGKFGHRHWNMFLSTKRVFNAFLRLQDKVNKESPHT